MRDSDGNWIDTSSAWGDPSIFRSPEHPEELYVPEDTTEMDRKFAELLEEMSK